VLGEWWKPTRFFRSDAVKRTRCRWDRLADFAHMILRGVVACVSPWMRTAALSLFAGHLLSGSCRMQVCSKVSVLTQHNQWTTLYLSKSFPKEDNTRKENK
jgi:hypothetical protein